MALLDKWIDYLQIILLYFKGFNSFICYQFLPIYIDFQMSCVDHEDAKNLFLF
jgi:hypothetical protein